MGSGLVREGRGVDEVEELFGEGDGKLGRRHGGEMAVWQLVWNECRWGAEECEVLRSAEESEHQSQSRFIGERRGRAFVGDRKPMARSASHRSQSTLAAFLRQERDLNLPPCSISIMMSTMDETPFPSLNTRLVHFRQPGAQSTIGGLSLTISTVKIVPQDSSLIVPKPCYTPHA